MAKRVPRTHRPTPAEAFVESVPAPAPATPTVATAAKALGAAGAQSSKALVTKALQKLGVKSAVRLTGLAIPGFNLLMTGWLAWDIYKTITGEEPTEDVVSEEFSKRYGEAQKAHTAQLEEEERLAQADEDVASAYGVEGAANAARMQYGAAALEAGDERIQRELGVAASRWPNEASYAAQGQFAEGRPHWLNAYGIG